MLGKTKVYWAHNCELLFNDIVGYPPERLLPYMKKGPMWRSDTLYAKILECPATIENLKNAYALRCPLDILNKKDESGVVHTLPQGYTHQPNEYIQLANTAGWFFFSEKPVTMSVTPPFMHSEGIIGVSATYDISKWFRQVHPTILMENHKEFEVKRGRPLMYVSFDRPVELVPFDFTEKLMRISVKSAEIKHVIPRLSMKYLYSMFDRNSLRQKVLKEIKDNLL